MSTSANLALPFIEGGELLPDVTLNETLRLIDTLVQLAIVDRDLNAPPGSPAEGQRWIVKASPSPTGAWAGHGNQIAAWQDGGWVFCAPQVGWFAYVIDEGALVAWSGSAWVSALAMLAILQNLSLLGVGTAADATNPFSAKLNNALWVARTVAEGGDGHLRYKMSKESAAKTLSLLFQDNFSGRAEMGLTGDDDFHFKVSGDGSSWLDAITIDRTTGKLTINQGFASPAAARIQLYAAPADALAFSGLQLNGAAEISQENGASAVTLTASSSLQTKYLLDGITAHYRGSFVATAQQVAAPSGMPAKNALKIAVATAQGSLGANDELSIVLPIEGLRTARLLFGTSLAARQSLGFWISAHRTGTYSGSVRNSAKNRSYPFSFIISAADTPQWVSLAQTGAGDTSIPGDTAGSWLNDTGVGQYVTICLAGGSSRTGTANAWAGSDYSGASGTANGVAATTDLFYLSNMIVLPGIELPSPDRAPFVMRPAAHELAAADGCRRYYQKIVGSAGAGFGSGPVVSATACNSITVPLLGPFRNASPSVSLTGTCSIYDGSVQSVTSISAIVVTENAITFDATVASGLTAGRFGKFNSGAANSGLTAVDRL